MPALKDSRHEVFCQEYSVTGHGANSWIEAGGSPKSAAAQASRLLKKSNIQARILELKGKAQERAEIDAAWVLDQAAKMFSADLRKIYDDDGNMLPPKDWPDDVALAIDSIDTSHINTEGGPIITVNKVRRINRLRVLEVIGKHIDVQAFKEKVEHDVSDKLADAIMRGRARAGRKKDD